MPTAHPGIQENLHFLLNEVETHCHLVDLFFKTHSLELLPRIRARRGYVQTLREKIESQCVSMLARRKPGTVYYMRVEAIRSLSAALEGVSSNFVDCVQEGTLTEAYIHPGSKGCCRLVRRIARALNLIKLGMDKAQRRTGIKLGRRRNGLLSLYDEIQTTTLVAKESLSDNQLRAAIVSNFGLKQVIDQLAIVGEALIKADLGQVVSLQNYDHLRNTTSTLNYSLRDLKVRRLALTRSGSAIAAISHKDESDQEVLAVYKEGDRSKLAEEIQGVNNWQKVDRKLAPDVLAHTVSEGGSSALLIEHLAGKTLEALLFEGRQEAVAQALARLFKTLEKIWKTTYTPEPSYAKFMAQLDKRIGDSIQIHPDFFTDSYSVCGLVRPAFRTLISTVQSKESRWMAPFSVLIHGDFNLDNLIYDAVEDRIYFIDLHRSTYLDYVQDISVLMVSIYRLQVLSGSTRELMMDSAIQIYRFARRFAKRHGDHYFEPRLAAGLARSFATSTRFIFDKKLASRMHLRARYLLEQLAQLTPAQELRFKIPLEDLYSE
ncbi:MAG: aminoglycoside phosphotransferase (APT) family kinase protein [Motiliproteus sp.]|jgi:aminoglycoside phosphotransferase (APT) family kinase protein